MSDERTPLLVTKDLQVTFRRGDCDVLAVAGLSYELRAGTTLAVIGESGSGKTVACLALTGLLPAGASVAGSVRFEGKELLGLHDAELRRYRGAAIAMAFQDSARSLNPTMRIGRQICEGIRRHDRLDGRAARARAIELLRLLQVPAPEQRFFAFPHQLSGGMRQRVMLAIAIACRPKVLIADEITASLDVITHRQIMRLLLDLQKKLGMALVVVTHDVETALDIADDVLVMQAGRAVEHSSARRLLSEPRTAYTRELLDAVPRLSGTHRPVSRKQCATARAETDTVLEVRNLRQRYALAGRWLGVARRSFDAISDISFKMSRGETLGLVGESGSGKSTLARAILQIPPPQHGSVLLLNTDLTALRGRQLLERRRHVQMVFQDPFTSLDPTWQVSEIVGEPLLCYGIGDRRKQRRRVAEVLELVGLPISAYGRRWPRELSGGQCQRVAIARALAVNPTVIVCDEAVSSLDALVRVQVLALFEQLRQRLDLSYLFISHDLAVVRQISDRVAVLRGGRLCEIGPTDTVYGRPGHPYTGALFEATRRSVRDTTVSLVASAPRTTHEPAKGRAGCQFLGSCSRAKDVCATQTPQLRRLEPRHFVACHFPLPASTEARLESVAAASARHVPALDRVAIETPRDADALSSVTLSNFAPLPAPP